METNVNEPLDLEQVGYVDSAQQPQLEQKTLPVQGTAATVDLNFAVIFKWALLVLGICFIVYGGYLYTEDLDYYSDPMMFYEKRYVGGDAYNYIISAARSTAIMVKSLIWVVLGSTAVLVSRTIHTSKS